MTEKKRTDRCPADGSEVPATTSPTAPPDLASCLAALWQAIAVRMADLPVYNPKLTVQTTAFRRHGSWYVGVVVTPWFMNVIAVPDDPAELPPSGTSVTVKLPAGLIEAIAADLDGFGRLATASLFSPMNAFGDPAVTAATAQAALDALFQSDDAPPRPPSLDRRRLFFGSASARTEG
ncbi:MAG: [NiFe]-hydrogenase assembly chaperone HybE [Rhodopila sp.]